MPRPARFKYTKTDRGWLVNVTAKHSATGRREQRYFPTREKAKEFAAELREKAEEHGKASASISTRLAEEAKKASDMLKPYGVSLLQVANAYIEAENERQASVPVEAATKAFQRAKEGLSEKQRSTIYYTCRHLNEDFPGRMLSAITTEELTEHIGNRTNGASAYNGKRRVLVTLWRWASSEPREWCRAKVAERIETAPTVAGEVGILSSKEVKALMAAAEEHFPDTVPAFAIALFTGMRQAEIKRLKPADLTEDGITVPAVSAKSKRRRFIDMTPQLAAWLEAYPVGKTVCPSNWTKKEIAVRRLAGWRVWSNLVKPHDPPGKLPPWPQNALRHTHATVALATGATLEDLTFSFGHTGGSAMLKQHYAGAISKKEALAICRIGPKGRKLPAIRVA